jgi:hypothetical protein
MPSRVSLANYASRGSAELDDWRKHRHFTSNSQLV